MDMRRALKESLASYKIPSEMKVLDAIPRNAMGKGEIFLILFLWFNRWTMLTVDS
jgi:acyl-coenzyme A synthetase/AMP-(fatty) acid ligase